MDVDQQVINESSVIAAAVMTILDPQSSPSKRHDASNICEDIKESTNPMRVSCALYLVMQESNTIVRHFGLQLLEHIIKFQWYQLDMSQKVCIKETLLKVMKSLPASFVEQPHLHNSLAKVLVEMMKREWPQQWPDLISEMKEAASNTDPTTSTIVLLMFLRFIEDVATLQTMEMSQRRKDLCTQFANNADTIMSFAVDLLIRFSTQNTPSTCRMVNVGVNLCSEIIEASVLGKVFDERLIPLLCKLIECPNYTAAVSDCFLRFASKNGRTEERKNSLNMLLNAGVLQIVSRMTLLFTPDQLDEASYVVAKKVVELVCAIAKTMCVTTTAIDIPKLADDENFNLLLHILTKLSIHNSHLISYSANSILTDIFKHADLGPKVVEMGLGQSWTASIFEKFLRVPYSNEEQLFQSVRWYMKMDFDVEETYMLFFNKYRVELIGAIKNLTVLAPEMTFTPLLNWAGRTMHLTSNSGKEDTYQLLCWDALVSVTDGIISSIPAHKLPVDLGLQLLRSSLGLNIHSSEIESFNLSIISACMVFVNSVQSVELRNSITRGIMEKICQCLSYKSTERNLSQLEYKKIVCVRRHAGSLLVKQTTRFPTLFYPFFDDMCILSNHLKNNAISNKLPVALLLESLLLLNNTMVGYERQSTFVSKIINEIRPFWDYKFNQAMASVDQFISYIGLNVPLPANKEKDICRENRDELTYCLEIMVSVVKRTVWQSDMATPEERDNLPVLGHNEDGTPVIQNPAAPHVIPYIVQAIRLVRTLHILWTDEFRNKINPDYQIIFEMTDNERRSILGKSLLPSNVESYWCPRNHMHRFLYNLYENCFLLLTKTCENLHYSFYSLPSFPNSIEFSVFAHLNSIPDYRLRLILKGFMRSLISNCPPTMYESLLVPILSCYTMYMYERLCNQWSAIRQVQDSNLQESDRYDEKEEAENHLREAMCMQLCREHEEIVKLILFDTRSPGSANKPASEPFFINETYESLSKLGIICLRNDCTRYGIGEFVLNCLTWPDSVNSFRCCLKVPPIVKQLLEDNIMDLQVAVRIIDYLLESLQVHGQHDSNQGTILICTIMVYRALRPKFPQLYELLAAIPTVNKDDLKKFDDRINMIERISVVKTDRALKDMFRKLVSPLIARNVGEWFKLKECIRDLPRAPSLRPKGQNVLDNIGSTEEGLFKIFNSN